MEFIILEKMIEVGNLTHEQKNIINGTEYHSFNLIGFGNQEQKSKEQRTKN